MAVKIRLSRVGRKHIPFYRIVAVDSRKKRDGEFLDEIGTYDAIKTQIVNFNEELYQKWVGLGATPSDTARKIYRLFKKVGIAAPTEKPMPQISEKPAPKKAEKKVEEEPKKEAAPQEVKKEEAPKEAAKEKSVETEAASDAKAAE